MLLKVSDFKRLVRVEALAKKIKVPLNLLDAISDIFATRDQTSSDLIPTVIALAQHEMAHLGTAQKQATRLALADRILGLTTPEALLSSRQREDAVRPYVEQLRLEYFKVTTVPFPSYEEAVIWLRGRAVTRKQMSKRLLRDVLAAMKRFPKHYKLELSLGSHGIPLLAPKPGALKGWVEFDKGSALENLKKITESMSSGTGCDVALCVAHVLTGTPLILRPLHWTIELSAACGLERASATIEILQPHAVTLKVLVQGFRLIRKELGLAKKKTMTGRHERLLRLIEKHGGAPGRHKTAFWKCVQHAWNKTAQKGEHPYETWRGPMMAYRRIQRALKMR